MPIAQIAAREAEVALAKRRHIEGRSTLPMWRGVAQGRATAKSLAHILLKFKAGNLTLAA